MSNLDADGIRISQRRAIARFLIFYTNKSEATVNRRNIFNLSLVTALGLVLLPGSVLAQQKSSKDPSSVLAQQKSLKDQIVGTWTVVSWDQVDKDGKKSQRFGAAPKGVSVFDVNGRFFVMFARADLPKLASNDPMKTTSEENKAIMEGSIAYFGTYSVDEMNKSMILRVESSTFPNQVGSEQKRSITSITANDLKISNTAGSSGSSINYVFKRASILATN